MELTQNSPHVEWALYYANLGWRVFPLSPGEKIPIKGMEWKTAATSNPETIQKMWEQYPTANIAIVTGNLIVIDLDLDEEKGKNGIKELERYIADNGAFPETAKVKTGRGGMHLYYTTAEELRNSAGKLLPGVDIRASGGYIVAPPSVHKNGNRYEWIDGVPKAGDIAAADENVLKFMHSADNKKKKAPAIKPRTVELVQFCTEGQRNDTLFRAAAALQAKGYEDALIVSEIERMNAEQCSPSLEEKEVAEICRSAIERYPKGIVKIRAAVVDFEGYCENLSRKFPFMIPKEDRSGNITYSVSAPRLAEHFAQKERFFFTKGEKPLAYLYNKEQGVYQFYSENRFKGEIKKYVEAFGVDYVRVRDMDEAYKLLTMDPIAFRNVNDLNSCETLINFQNGLLNIETLALSPHSPEILSTIQLPCKWDNSKLGKAPVFDEFIARLTDNNPKIARILLEYMGLTISNIPGWKTKKAVFLYGPGNTGKSQFLKLLSMLVGGENYSSIDMKSLEERFGTSQLFQKRLAGAPDMSAMKVDELKVFKKITGGDELSFEFKGKDVFTGKYNGTLVFCSNELPKFGGDRGEHVYERMLLIECKNVIPSEKRDPQLIEKLSGELEAIACSAVHALRVLKANDFHFDIPAECLKNVKAYKVENNNVLQFLEEHTCERTSPTYKDTCTTGVVFQAYKNWTKAACLYTQSLRDFKEGVAEYCNSPLEEIETKQQGRRYYSFTLNKEGRELIGCIS